MSTPTLPDDTTQLMITAGFSSQGWESSGEVLTPAGQPVSEDGTPRTLWGQADEMPNYLVIQLTGPRSFDPPTPLEVTVVVTDSEPRIDDLEQWDTIEEAGAWLKPPVDVLGGGFESVPALGSAITEQIASGWHVMRVSVRNLGFASSDTPGEVRIQLWPTPHSSGLRRIRHQPAKVARSRGPAAVDVPSEWSRLIAALRRAGDTTVTVSDAAYQARIPDLRNAVHSAVEASDVELTDELYDWFTITAIYPSRHWSLLIPTYDILTFEDARAVRQQLLDAWTPSDWPQEAGTPAYTFIPEYLPLAERDGYLLVADLRPGEKRGQILEFDKVDADDDTTTWRSMRALLHQLATAIEDRRPFNSWQPNFDTGSLHWTLDPT